MHTISFGAVFAGVIAIFRAWRMVKGRSWNELTARRGTGTPKYSWIAAILIALALPWWGAYPLASLVEGTLQPSPTTVETVRFVLCLVIAIAMVIGVGWLKLSENRRIRAGVLRNQNRPELIDDAHQFRVDALPDAGSPPTA